jgi:hypothetical protein
MNQGVRSFLLVGLAFAALGATKTPAKDPPPDCSSFTLDGYRLGMRGDEILAVRSVTLHVEGQAQVLLPGRFRGVLVLDGLNRLEKWNVIYDAHAGDDLREVLRASLGEPVSDVTGDAIDDGTTTVRQRRTIWLSDTCDAAIILYDNTTVKGAPGHTVHASLARASGLDPRVIRMKTLLP